MPRAILHSDPDFNRDLENYLKNSSAVHPEVAKTVSGIISDVALRRDGALLEYTQKFDDSNASISSLKVTSQEIDEAVESCPADLWEALGLACQRIESYHRKQRPEDLIYKDNDGVTLGWKWNSVDSAGIYVPGGKASYPSTVLMNAIPAKIAGVKRIVMAVPAPNGELNNLVLAAANAAGIEEIYRIGGAQAIAALTHGTQTIPKVDMIAGPGNVFVTEAKRQLFGTVGIDMIAGPSEILVIADDSANAEWIAADLLSQAEHDANARSILITDNKELAESIEGEIERTLSFLPRAAIAKASWRDNGLIIVVENIQDAAEISNRIAPEHLEIATEEPEAIMGRIRNAGAIFLGHYTPEAMGDYIAGPSHVLPTSGNARFASGLSVLSFMKRTSIMGFNKQNFAKVAERTSNLAQAEGLDAHALSVSVRMED